MRKSATNGADHTYNIYCLRRIIRKCVTFGVDYTYLTAHLAQKSLLTARHEVLTH